MITVVIPPGETVELRTLEPFHARAVIDDKTVAVIQTLQTPDVSFIRPLTGYVKRERKKTLRRWKGTKLDPKFRRLKPVTAKQRKKATPKK